MERNQEMKADNSKPMMELIPTSVYKSLGTVLTYGAIKYKPNGWKDVEAERYVGALMRHLIAYMDNPYSIDKESGLLHIEHALCNVAFLNHFVAEEIEEAESWAMDYEKMSEFIDEDISW